MTPHQDDTRTAGTMSPHRAPPGPADLLAPRPDPGPVPCRRPWHVRPCPLYPARMSLTV